MNSWARAAAGVVVAGAATFAYAAGIERRHWTLREATLPVLPPGTRDIRVLHITDLHMTPGQRSKQRWVAGLAELEPDLVVDTGDNLAHARAVPAVLTALDPLLSRMNSRERAHADTLACIEAVAADVLAARR